MAELIKLKHVGRSGYTLDLRNITPGKILDLKPGSTFSISNDEYEFLSTSCPKVFSLGFFDTMTKQDDTKVDLVMTENKMTEDEIKKFIDSTQKNQKEVLDTITSVELLKDIRLAAVEEDKTKLIKFIDDRITVVSDGSKLL